MSIFVLDSEGKPLTPCHAAVARKLLATGKAAIWRRAPLTIILKRCIVAPTTEPLRLKIDPGSRTTGMVLLNERTGAVPFAAEIEHRGLRVKDRLSERRALRRQRRQRKTRYRPARFQNRRRRQGWLPPSLESRVANVVTWVERLQQFAPVGSLSLELVKFDTQALENPEVNGVEYQQGELAGYEVREYLLEKWQRRCAYCGAEKLPLQIEHIQSRRHGGSDRVSNLTLACARCNQAKSDQPIAQFLAKKPELLRRILIQAKTPLKDAAALNATRWAIFERLQRCSLPLETGSGGRTKFNRCARELPKTHWIDAACVGSSTPERLDVKEVRPWLIRAMGWGRRQRCKTDCHGFPKAHAPRRKSFLGFQTGDRVRANIPEGKYAGKHEGRVTIRFRPSFNIGSIGVHPRHLKRIQAADGYDYRLGEALKILPCAATANSPTTNC